MFFRQLATKETAPSSFVGIGALGLGIAAHFSGQMEAAIWFVAISMFASGSILWWLGEETHPRLNPATEGSS